MKICRNTLLLAISLTLLSVGAMAQTARLRAANKQFEDMSYLNAVRSYEDFLRLDKRGDPAERREALTKLGYSYRRLQDSRNAERVYGELVDKYTDLPSETYLYYAQSLAKNRKYNESRKMYAKYGEMQTEGPARQEVHGVVHGHEPFLSRLVFLQSRISALQLPAGGF